MEVEGDLCASGKRLGVFSDDHGSLRLRHGSDVSGDGQSLQNRNFFVRVSQVVASRTIDLPEDIKDPGGLDRDLIARKDVHVRGLISVLRRLTQVDGLLLGGRLALSGQLVQSQGAVSDGDGVTRIVVQAASLRDKVEKLYPAHEGVSLRILNRAVDRHRVPARFLDQHRHLRATQKAALAKVPFHSPRKLLRGEALCLDWLAKQRE